MGQEAHAEQSKAVREAQLQAQEQVAEAARQLGLAKEGHAAALHDTEAAAEGRLAEAARQLQHLKDEHQKAVSSCTHVQ